MGPSTPNGPLCIRESPRSGGHHTYISRAEPQGCQAFPLHKDYISGNMFSVIPALLVVGMPGVNWLPN